MSKSAIISLETPEAQGLLSKLKEWRTQARTAQSANRIEMAIDEDYFDNIQIEPLDAEILAERGQSPATYNLCKKVASWITGTEKKSRIDYRILPRSDDDVEAAKNKTKVMKYIQDVSGGEYARSEAFADQVIAGLGWIEVGASPSTEEIIFIRSENWRNMWYDHLSIRTNRTDMRFVLREKWLDLDVAQAMFPRFEGALEVEAKDVNSLYPSRGADTSADQDLASEHDEEDSSSLATFGSTRKRVRVSEMEYRMPERVKILKMRDKDTPFGALHGRIYRPEREDHAYLVKGGYFKTTEEYLLVVNKAMWAGRTFLFNGKTPYDHNRFSFIPHFCYQRRRDNMPYGVIRDIRDPQAEVNRMRRKAVFLSSTKRMVIEEGAVDDYNVFHNEMQRPDGIGQLKPGGLGKIKELDEPELTEQHLRMAQECERFIFQISGVSADAEWQKRKDLSGVAMGIQERQSMTAHGTVFDNHYLAFQQSGELVLALMEQFYDQEREVRITGEKDREEFVKINQRNSDGSIDRKNSIIASKADFIVGKQDYRETERQRLSEMLTDLIMSLVPIAPNVAMTLLDVALEMMDGLPNKEEVISRVRKVTGVEAPDEDLTEEQKAEKKQQMQAQAQEVAAAKQLQQAMAQIKIMEGQSKAMMNFADASMKKLDSFLKAMEVAGSITMTPQLVTAADQLIAEAQGTGEGADEQGQVAQGQSQQPGAMPAGGMQ